MNTIGMYCVAACMLSLLVYEGVSRADGLTIKSVELRDGSVLRLGAPVSATSFRVRVSLKNSTKETLQIWAPNSPEGQQALRIEFSQPKRKTVRLTVVPGVTFGRRSLSRLAPGAVSVHDLNIGETSGLEDLSSGQWTMTVVYENALGNGGPDGKIWTGRTPGVKTKVTVESSATSRA